MSPIIEVLFCDLFLFCERFFYLFLSSCLWFFGVLLFGIEWNGGYVIGSGYKVTHEVQVPGSGPSNPVRFLLTASLLALWFSRASAKPFQKYFYIFRKQVSSTLLFLFFLCLYWRSLLGYNRQHLANTCSVLAPHLLHNFDSAAAAAAAVVVVI